MRYCVLKTRIYTGWVKVKNLTKYSMTLCLANTTVSEKKEFYFQHSISWGHIQMFRQCFIAKSENHTVLDSCKSDPVYIA